MSVYTCIIRDVSVYMSVCSDVCVRVCVQVCECGQVKNVYVCAHMRERVCAHESACVCM